MDEPKPDAGEDISVVTLTPDELLADVREGRIVHAVHIAAILLAKEVTNPPQRALGVLDISIRRNAYGRQLDSSIRTGTMDGHPLEMVFIRAPKIERLGPDVEVVATEGNDPVAVRQGKTMAATFHPELSDDTAIHRAFLKLVGNG